MDIERFLTAFRDALRLITQKRYYKTERGFQARLITELDKHLEMNKIFPSTPIIEQEYQKILDDHGITIRPDIIIHVPFNEESNGTRRQNNYVVIQLKLQAEEKRAIEDFEKIDLMFEHLDYGLGIFLNIDSDETYIEKYTGNYRKRLRCFATYLLNDAVVVSE